MIGPPDRIQALAESDPAVAERLVPVSQAALATPSEMPTAVLLDAPDRGVLVQALSWPCQRYVEWTSPARTGEALFGCDSALLISLTTRSAYGAVNGPVIAQALVDRQVISDAKASDIACSVQEAIANAVLHGNLAVRCGDQADPDEFLAFHQAVSERLAMPDALARRVTIGLNWTQSEVTAVVTDDGDGFEPTEMDVAPLDCSPSGRGIGLMRQFSSRVEFSQGGRSVSLSFARA